MPNAYPNLLVITGPTASGKTALGIALAQALDGEIISADARQIYRWMNIGTAKPTVEEQRAARHHLIDIRNPDEPYSAGLFARDAAEAIRDLHARNKLPIVVGGAGFYIRALLDGFSPIPDIPEAIRNRLRRAVETDRSRLFEQLCAVDPAWAAQIKPTDTQRLVRGLEVWEATGRTLTSHQTRPPEKPGTWSFAWFGMAWPRDCLHARIHARAEQMLADGLVEEVERLAGMGYGRNLGALNTFGYREIFAFLEGEISLAQALADIQQGTRRYAKRQMTWFRRETRIIWMHPVRCDAKQQVLQILKSLDRPGQSL